MDLKDAIGVSEDAELSFLIIFLAVITFYIYFFHTFAKIKHNIQ